ncbi:MAG: redoxin domain-containing protein [Chloroflexi bacterium]|nr:MAG: redoxin domain-containing protein [Chloroflexota bacterium]
MRREELAPNVGDEAPDFNLPVLHGDGQRVSLSALRGQPVALFFGSYT